MKDRMVGLAAAIEALRAELTDAMDQGSDKRMQFRLDPVEVTLQVTVTKEVNGKIGWSVLGLGGSGESADTQTLTLRLTPVWRTVDGTRTTDFMIASVGPAGDVFGPQSPPATEPR